MKKIKSTLSLLIVFAMLICTPLAHGMTIYSNGNEISQSGSVGTGIISAVSDKDGIIAIAAYKEGSLIALDFVPSEEGLKNSKANLIVGDEDGVTVKVFNFDDKLTPYCEEINLAPEKKNYRVYINENFDDGKSLYVSTDSHGIAPSSGRIKLTYVSNDNGSGTRLGLWNIYYPDRHLIIEADFSIPNSITDLARARLICAYDNGTKSLIELTSNGITIPDSNKTVVCSASDIKSKLNTNKKFNVALKIDLETLTCDAYIDRQKVTQTPYSVQHIISEQMKYNGFGICVPHLKDADGLQKIYVDNVKAYSGTEFIDIGNEIPTSYITDFANSTNWVTSIYERPDAVQIAAKAMETGHPRLLINSDKLSEIASSNDTRIIEWKNELMQRANSYISTEPYTYALSRTGSLQNIPEGKALMMDLGLAYMLTGDKKYSDRAYREAEVLYIAPYTESELAQKLEEDIDYWNSHSYLDVGEISFILGLCYDWMYDAWTPAQRQELTDNVMEKGILRSYRTYFSQLNPTNKSTSTWYDAAHNWNAICNGGSLMAAIAFMDEDPYLCGSVASAAIKGFEHLLEKYAPAGAWDEGAGYWAYTLSYLTASCATLEAACGTDYGIHKTTGLEGSQLYSLSVEGKVGMVNFGDSGNGRVDAPFLFYWADKYQNKDIGGAGLYIKEVFECPASAFDLIYYNPEYVKEDYIPPVSFYYPGTEMVSFTSSHDKTAPFVAISGGLGVSTSHDHLDSGSVVVDIGGDRLIHDIGAGKYDYKNYFSTYRYYYYMTRPEGHNIFVINPQNLYDTDGTTFYHGQSASAVSTITSYDKVNQTAVMDLGSAYKRDASSATRKISLGDQSVVIEDDITLLSVNNNIEWYYHFKDTATETINGSSKDLEGYTTAEVSQDGKSVILTVHEYEINGKNLVFTGETKTYTITFDAQGGDFKIELGDAVRNTYDADIINSLIASGDMSDITSDRSVYDKITVKINNASGNVKLKATIK